MFSAHQVPDNDLRPGRDSQVERGELLGILNSRVHVCTHADQKQHAFNVALLYRSVQEITALVVNLEHMKWNSQ